MRCTGCNRTTVGGLSTVCIVQVVTGLQWGFEYCMHRTGCKSSTLRVGYCMELTGFNRSTLGVGYCTHRTGCNRSTVGFGYCMHHTGCNRSTGF